MPVSKLHLTPEVSGLDYPINDFDPALLNQAKDLWAVQLIEMLTPTMLQAFQSMFDQSIKLCRETNEMSKYIVNFQNILSTIAKWNTNQVEEETQRIQQAIHCDYLEEIITSVHILHLKLMTCIRVSNKSKQIQLDIPSLSQFIHKCYLQSARLFWKNAFLFQKNLPDIKTQEFNYIKKNLLEKSILLAVNESIPMDKILRAYMDETIEEEVEIIEEPLPQPEPQQPEPQQPEPQQPQPQQPEPQQPEPQQPEPQQPQQQPSPKSSVSFNETIEEQKLKSIPTLKIENTLDEVDLSIFDNDIEILN